MKEEGWHRRKTPTNRAMGEVVKRIRNRYRVGACEKQGDRQARKGKSTTTKTQTEKRQGKMKKPRPKKGA